MTSGCIYGTAKWNKNPHSLGKEFIMAHSSCTAFMQPSKFVNFPRHSQTTLFLLHLHPLQCIYWLVWFKVFLYPYTTRTKCAPCKGMKGSDNVRSNRPYKFRRATVLSHRLYIAKCKRRWIAGVQVLMRRTIICCRQHSFARQWKPTIMRRLSCSMRAQWESVR